jgi:Tol biopolymer transport system component/predicted Ser/Thr protein kinase
VPLAAGTRLGPYEIVSPLGAGGMGEVYRARDQRLNRTVAIKVLARHLSNRPDFKARFEREAQTLASLSHPHICPVFDVGRHEGTDYIVMEYVEGRTLADRLERGPMQPDEAVRIGIEIADALDSAHQRGIIHRDLKPGNIMLTKSGAKLLDFGLAKLALGTSVVAAVTTAAAPAPVTAEGTILGTVQYMAPEQLEGKEADSRTDIFAFGSIVHEMITGAKTFTGSSQASLIAAILEHEPAPMTTAQPLTPPLLDRVVRKCLAKNPDRRWQAAGDIRDELTWIADAPELSGRAGARSAGRSRRAVFVWALLATALLTAAVLMIAVRSRTRPAAQEQVRFNVVTPNLPNSRYVTMSPDGRWIAFPASTASRAWALYVRRLDSTTAEQLPGTEGAAAPFWSPDSRYLAFFAGGRLKKIAVSGGPVQNICDAVNERIGGTWNRADTVIFAASGNLHRVSAAGGEPLTIGSLDRSREETARLQPSFLPDGIHFLYLSWSSQQSRRAVYLGSLESNETVKLFDSQSKAAYAAPGYILFHRLGALLAQPFDPLKFVLTGPVVRVADEISYDLLTGDAAFAVSDNDRLIYYAGGGPAIQREFVWVDRNGQPESTSRNPGLYTSNFDLSPDGTRIAVAQRNPDASEYDISVIDWQRHTQTRATFDPTLSANGNVVWSPDNVRLAFSSERSGNRDIFATNAGGPETPLLATSNDEWPEDWSKDGRYLAYGVNSGTASFGDIYALPLFGKGQPIAVAHSRFLEDEPRFSFDGKWLAYNSNESGKPQVYVVSFPGLAQRMQLSSAGGVQPRWRRDDKEIYYLGPDGAMMAVAFPPAPNSAAPRALFNSGLAPDDARDQFAVSPDGQRFLLQLPAPDSGAVPVTVVLNWTAGLTK